VNPLQQTLLNAYYLATLPARQRAATERAERQTEPVCMLFYHRVADRYPNAWSTPTVTFAEQIRWLRGRFDLVSLAEAQKRIELGRNRRPTACITFDDGYAENCQFAIPLLLRERIPFTYFVSTRNVLGGEPFPHDAAAGQPLPPNTAKQLRDLVAAGVEVGAHSRNHVRLGTATPRRTLHYEIASCKRELEEALEHEVRYFAFPYGQVGDMCAEACQIAYQAGYHGVCSAFGGYNFPGDDPFHLRRIHADPEFIRFKNWLTLDPRKLRKLPQFDPGSFRGGANSANPIVADAPQHTVCRAAR